MTPIEIDADYIRPRILNRENYSHKRDYGHLLIIAGCQQMPGAAVLAAGAALKSGCGLVTLHSTDRALQAVVNNYPSAILSENPGTVFSKLPDKDFTHYSAIAVGPGLGKASETRKALIELLGIACNNNIPMVFDADALNILSETDNWQSLIPHGSVLTPHMGELRRLISWENEKEMEQKISEVCKKTESVLVMKGYRTSVFTPSGDRLFNTTGNPGMAKGGSGDVLTGLIGGLMARGYNAQDAAAIGVWIHGYAGDFLTMTSTAEAYNSNDLIDMLWSGFVAINKEPEEDE